MGHQISNIQYPTLASQKHQQSKLSPKTNFYYIHPIRCQLQENSSMEQENIQSIPQGVNRTHEQQYLQIEKNQQQPTVNSLEDLGKIQQIKVKWNSFIKMKKRNYLEDYTVLKEIGRGGFGCVHKVKARYTGLYRAAKRIKKAQLKKVEHEKLFEQMAIMISLDHPNIAKLYQVYDYKSYYVLILELCEGGQLFKKIVTKQLTEQSSAKIMKQILWTLIYLHKKGIVHRDLKPQNMLFQQNSDMIKIIDFGIAIKKKDKDQVLTARIGTPYYIAPEVLCKNYSQKCDIWSAGVILFMMISGRPPFRGENEYDVMQNILKQNVQFRGSKWSRVSSECKQMIAQMLKKNPNQRPSAQQAFNHPWINKLVLNQQKQKQQLIISNIRDFSVINLSYKKFENKLQAVVYTYIVSQLLTSQQKKILFQTFKQLDKNNDGVIQSSQLYDALRDNIDINQERVNFLMRIIDTNGSGQIDYTEFLVAGINPKKSLTQQHFQQAFQYFDIDHSGAITFQQIAHFLQDTKQSQQSIKKIFQQVDQNNDGNISKEQFVKLLMQATKKKLTQIYSAKLIQDAKKQTQKKTKIQNILPKNNKKQTAIIENINPHTNNNKNQKQNKTPPVQTTNKQTISSRKTQQENKKRPLTPTKTTDKPTQGTQPSLVLRKNQLPASKDLKGAKKVTILG